jgi:hypothetical protein
VAARRAESPAAVSSRMRQKSVTSEYRMPPTVAMASHSHVGVAWSDTRNMRSRHLLRAVHAVVAGAVSGCAAAPHVPTASPAAPTRYVRLHVGADTVVGRWRSASQESVAVVVARTHAPHARATWSVGADIVGDSVVLSVAWDRVGAWAVASRADERRVPRSLVVAAGFAGAAGLAWLAGGSRGDALQPLLGAAATGALLGASHPERRLSWQSVPVPFPRPPVVAAAP